MDISLRNSRFADICFMMHASCSPIVPCSCLSLRLRSTVLELSAETATISLPTSSIAFIAPMTGRSLATLSQRYIEAYSRRASILSTLSCKAASQTGQSSVGDRAGWCAGGESADDRAGGVSVDGSAGWCAANQTRGSDVDRPCRVSEAVPPFRRRRRRRQTKGQIEQTSTDGADDSVYPRAWEA